jgi:2-oxoglutarate ferredoxin oxidoreductase subunit alpha
VRAFDLAERFQTPVFVASDLDIGMNDWMCRRLHWDDGYRPDRGKVLAVEELERIKRFSRYMGENGDAIAARTLPGIDARGSYFTRGSGHDVHAGYTEDAAAYAEVLARLARKLNQAAEAVPEPVIDRRGAGSSTGVITIGSCDAAVREAVDYLRSDGIDIDYMRIRGFPFGPDVVRFLGEHDRLFVVEQNRDAQLRSMLAIETGKPRDEMTPVLDYGGVPLSAEPIVEAVKGGLRAADRGLRIGHTQSEIRNPQSLTT